MTPCKIRRALASEAPQLTFIAIESKRHWGYPDHWINLWTESLTISSTYIDQHQVYLAEYDFTPVGFYALLKGTPWELDHLWVRPGWIRKGLGTQLFRHAMARLHELAPGAVLGIESDPNAEQFYLHMGARRVKQIERNWDGLVRVLPYLEIQPDGRIIDPLHQSHGSGRL